MIGCPGCAQQYCSLCLQDFLLSTNDNPHCFYKSCKIGFLPEFLAQYLDPYFLRKTLPDHQKDVLLLREKALLPLSQEAADQRMTLKRMEEQLTEVNGQFEIIETELNNWSDKQKVINDYKSHQTEENLAHLRALDSEICGRPYVGEQQVYQEQMNQIASSLGECNDLMESLLTMSHEESSEPIDHLAKLLRQTRKQLRQVDQKRWPCERIISQQISRVGNEHNELKNLMRVLKEDMKAIKRSKNSPLNSRETIACASKDCRGFTQPNGDHHHCHMCGQQTCSACCQSWTNDHRCDEHVLATIKLIRQTSTRCPGCGFRIHRIAGCPQMFCTECGTPFDYHTGRKLNGSWHNPHRIDGARRSTNEIADLSDIRTCETIYERVFPDRARDNYHRAIYNGVEHLQTQVLRRYRCNISSSLELQRVKYLTGEIDEKKWRSQIWSLERKNNRYREIRAVLTTLIHSGRDICLNLANIELERRDRRFQRHNNSRRNRRFRQNGRSRETDRSRKTNRSSTPDSETDNKLLMADALLEQARQLASQATETLRRIRQRFKCMVPLIDDRWRECLIMGNGEELDNEATYKKYYAS